MNVYIQIPLTDTQQKALLEKLFDETVWFASPEKLSEQDRKAFEEAEVAFGYCPPDWVGESKNLRWLQLQGVGFDPYLDLDWETLEERLKMTNLHGVFSQSVAETCVAGILAFTRGIKAAVELRPKHSWCKSDLRKEICSLAGAQVLVIGTGTIGRSIRTLLTGFGCEVRLYGQRPEVSDLTGLNALEKALSEVDIVCSVVPETSNTKELINADRLRLLSPHCLFVNAGRGSVVDEAALVVALQTRAIKGAVLDVTMTEPLPGNHPLWKCENVILTQHSAGGSNDEIERAVSFFLLNLERYRSGKPLLNPVNWARGY